MMSSRVEHSVTSTARDVSALPKTWKTVLEFVALVESLPESEWAQHAPRLRLLAAEIARETAELPRPMPDLVQRFLDRCAAR